MPSQEQQEHGAPPDAAVAFPDDGHVPRERDDSGTGTDTDTDTDTDTTDHTADVDPTDRTADVDSTDRTADDEPAAAPDTHLDADATDRQDTYLEETDAEETDAEETDAEETDAEELPAAESATYQGASFGGTDTRPALADPEPTLASSPYDQDDDRPDEDTADVAEPVLVERSAADDLTDPGSSENRHGSAVGYVPQQATTSAAEHAPTEYEQTGYERTEYTQDGGAPPESADTPADVTRSDDATRADPHDLADTGVDETAVPYATTRTEAEEAEARDTTEPDVMPPDTAMPAAAPVPVGVTADRDAAAPTDTSDDEAAEPASGTTELSPGDVTREAVAALWPAGSADGLRDRWRELQLRFVDDPHSATAEADHLVGEAVETLTGSLASLRENLAGWRSEGSGDTEQLRVAVQRYREFLDRVLGL